MALDLGFPDQEQIYGKTDIELFGREFGKRTMVDDLKIMETEQPLIGLMGITREINDLKENEINLQYLATHDPLTGLPNRYLMNDRLEQILTRSKRSKLIFSIFYIDLKDFKRINDSYGHEVGDLLLQQVAKRLKDCVRLTDTVARLGGDEFLIIFAGLARSEDVSLVADKVHACFLKSFLLEDYQVKVKASIGINLFPDHGEDQENLIKAADYAMYLARKRARRYMICPLDKSTSDKGEWLD